MDTIYSLIETEKLNAIDPETWLADIIPSIDDHPNKSLRPLLPWNWKSIMVGTIA